MKTNQLKEESGIALVIAMMLLLVVTVIGISAISTTVFDNKITGNNLEGIKAFYIAEAGINHSKAKLTQAASVTAMLNDASFMSQTISFGNGAYFVTGVGDATDPNRVTFTSEGTFSNGKKIISSTMTKSSGTTPRAAIVANGPIGTLGTLIVDGRNYDINGSLISPGGTGTLGITTRSTYDRSGNSKVGGTDINGVDIAPLKDPTSELEKIAQDKDCVPPSSWNEMLSPDQALGLPEGTLRSRATQYVTNPSDLIHPLSGVTYVELPSGGSWEEMDLEGTGILVVHNSAKNALMKNLNSGEFKGIIIADDLIHIHNEILGAVMVLSPNPSAGNCIGNGNGTVRYSKAAIDLAFSIVNGVTIVSWKEKF